MPAVTRNLKSTSHALQLGVARDGLRLHAELAGQRLDDHDRRVDVPIRGQLGKLPHELRDRLLVHLVLLAPGAVPPPSNSILPYRPPPRESPGGGRVGYLASSISS